MVKNSREGARNIEKDERNELFISLLLLGLLLCESPGMHYLTELLLSQSWADY